MTPQAAGKSCFFEGISSRLGSDASHVGNLVIGLSLLIMSSLQIKTLRLAVRSQIGQDHEPFEDH